MSPLLLQAFTIHVICLIASLAMHKRALASFRTSHARMGKAYAFSLGSDKSKEASSVVGEAGKEAGGSTQKNKEE